ncbi:UNVERIFIED_CONTAM: hypothetical protein NO986_11090 [Comamonas sp. A-3]
MYELAIDGGSKDFNQQLNASQREAAGSKAAVLAEQLSTASLELIDLINDAIESLQEQLGTRASHRADLVSPDSGEGAICLVGAERVARPMVKSTSAG